MTQDTSFIVTQLEQVVKDRAQRLLSGLPDSFLKLLVGRKFAIAGNSLNSGVPRDIDLFPLDDQGLLIQEKDCPFEILASTANALTIDVEGQVVQTCNYFRPSVEELVYSFDFTHIQVGVLVLSSAPLTVLNAYFTPQWVIAQAQGDSKYTGTTDYPLSSLLRVQKYRHQGSLSRRTAIQATFHILNHILERGFHDYEDFKDQLDAVDLGIVPEEQKELKSYLLALFENLRTDVR